jgi:hypothetical protein
MSAEDTKASRIRTANDLKPGSTTAPVANDFGARQYTVTTIERNALPANWKGRWVIIRNIGSNAARFAVSTSSTATVVAAPVSTAAGVSTQVGSYIAAGEVQQRQLPTWEVGSTLYLVRVAVSSTTELLIELGDAE